MTAEERKESWENLSSPKPDWETFKRMLPSCNNHPMVVRTLWLKKNSKTSVRIENVDKDRLKQWKANVLPVPSAERLKALSSPPDCVGCGKNSNMILRGDEWVCHSTHIEGYFCENSN